MPLQNRMTPAGEIIATESRGMLMGNRGILHEAGEIIRKSMHRGWIFCLLDFEGNHRRVMTEGRYTELFFLDEATAYAAGHRPCYDCQRSRFYRFRGIWTRTNARLFKLHDPMMADIDRVLHRERITRKEEKVTFFDYAINVGRGAFVEYENKYYLKWGNRFYEWTPSGYVVEITIPNQLKVKVLTPRSIERCFKNGLIPEVHESINEVITPRRNFRVHD